MDKFLEAVEKVWANSFVQALVYLIIGLIAAGIASFIIKKLCKLLKLDKRLEGWGVNEGGESESAIKFIGKLTFLIVFLLFLPSALHALGLESVSDPIIDFASTFIGYLPGVIAAVILVFVGIFLGQILSQIISALLSRTGLDNLSKKIAHEGGEDDEDNGGVRLSSVIGRLVNAAVVLVAVTQALIVLDIEAISAPALAVINAVFGAIPEIILAVIVVAVGLLITNILCSLIKNLLIGVNLDGLVRKVVPSLEGSYSLTRLITGLVRVLVMLFIIAESVEILGLAILTGIMSAVIAYLPMVLKAFVIALAAYVGVRLLESFMAKNLPNAVSVGAIIKVLIYVVAGFMILSQLDFATTIVNYAFIISLCALAVAFAIAFGIGGRDFARKTLDKVRLGEQGADSDRRECGKPDGRDKRD